MLLLPVMQFQVGSFCLRLRSLILPLRLNPHRVVNAICVAVAHSSSFPHFLQHFQFPVQSRAVADNCSNSPTTIALLTFLCAIFLISSLQAFLRMDSLSCCTILPLSSKVWFMPNPTILHLYQTGITSPSSLSRLCFSLVDCSITFHHQCLSQGRSNVQQNQARVNRSPL